MMYNLNSGEIQEANSKAISVWAYVQPPYLPDFEIIPMAFVVFIHCCGDIVNALEPDSFLKWSNSTTLKLELCICSHSPRNSMVLLSLSQFLTTSAGDVEFLYLAISVRQIYAFSSIVFPITPISTPFAFILDVGNIKSPPLINMIYCNIMYYQYMVVNIKLLHWRNEKSRMR